MSILVNAHPAKRYIGYSFAEQAKDILPAYLVSAASGLISYAPVLLLGDVPLSIGAQAIVFICAFLGISKVIKSEALSYLSGALIERMHYRKH